MDYNLLLEKAKEVSQNAYAPYSKFLVGACALYESGNTYTGCNVENASYGLSLCAERNAMSNAIAAGEKSELKAIAIYSPNKKMCTPCGACRQWMFEFSEKVDVILEDENNEIKIINISELLPYVFKL